MTEKGFREKLANRQKAIDSLVCVGLDPLPEKLPRCLKRKFWLSRKWKAIAQWMIDIVVATAPYASMFKLQRAHYEAFPDGRRALQAIISYIHEFYLGVPVFLDCKRGDIGRTQQRYRIAHFEIDGADGMNFSPYMGRDCMEYLIDKNHPGRAIVGLCHTSNPAAREVQDVIIQDGRCYWEFIAARTLAWAQAMGIDENAGLVMAAAYENPKGSGNIFSQHLVRCREIVGDKLWFLIPGIGAQGGFVKETVMTAGSEPGKVKPGEIAINSSSGITNASSEEDYAEAAAEEAKKLGDQIRDAGGSVA
ncbi:orotidine-5'-phosphate decarboxylase [Candidatus Falkowbacteria bacterium CG11_big_fil_rev_8_21_14_0_20_39_10]|uniref:Orotidine-5'-phosphate decarboxylase n=1 Tax=Candidatus Falkowbacteria bacterium CG11_big_fil_rev_8_21_14_0_20_39_10 TaxID=1974570 RepID=A0A2M6K9G5_9BACT|nr:MAG: orotidine-5'-phosphate decarboxylase [Candidatus Falkowbacteria bacterium CG11_big_fil_rev_8_21_14_0_20_39_10]